MQKLITYFTLFALGFFVSVFSATDPKPYEFNVYTIHDIGKTNAVYGSDFQGPAATGGNANFGGFSLNAVGPAYNYSLYSNGNVLLNSGSFNNGGVQAAGNISISSGTINGNISGGGNLQGGTGQVNGNVSISGTNTSSLTINGTTQTGQPFSPNLNIPSITQYFQNASSYWGGLSPTATYTNNFGQLVVSNLSSGRNVVNLTFADLSNSYGIALNGPADAFVIFNISDATPTDTLLKSVTFSYLNGISGTDVLFNLTNATKVNLNGGEYLSILAPNADITFPSGLVTGNLIANNLFGSGQVNIGGFTGFPIDEHNFNVQVPEPETYLTLAGFICLAFVLLRRRTHGVAKQMS